MAFEEIRLKYVVDHCKQLPTYRDALPIIDMLQSIPAEDDMVREIAAAISDIRSHFRMKQQPQEDHQQKKLPPPLLTPEMPELRFFKGVSDQKTIANIDVRTPNVYARVGRNYYSCGNQMRFLKGESGVTEDPDYGQVSYQGLYFDEDTEGNICTIHI